MDYITEALKQAIKDKKILRLKIMLKDSFVIDPTGTGFDIMYNYIKKNGIELYDKFDNGYLENDSSKWTKDLMNDELVDIMDNFSLERVNHLKKVVKYVLYEKYVLMKKENAKSESKYKINPHSTNCINKNDNNEKNMLESNIRNDIKKLQKYLVDYNAKGYWDIKTLEDIINLSYKINKSASLLKSKFKK